MKFRKIFQLEFAYQIRSLSTWLYFCVVAVLAFLWVIANYLSDAREGYFLLNAPIVIAAVTALCILFWLPLGGSVAGDAAARDVQTRMHSLTYTTPTSKATYLGGRFLAACLLNLVVLLSIPLSILFSLYFTGVEPEVMGPFRLTAYLTSFFYLLLPNIFIVTAIQFSLAALTRRPMASYLGGVFLFVCAFVLELVLQDAKAWANLIDPINFSFVLNQLSGEWSPLEVNTRLLTLEGPLLLNRIIWLSVAVGLLFFTHRRFRFVQSTTGGNKKHSIESVTNMPAQEWLKWEQGSSLAQVQGVFGFTMHLQQLCVITWKAFLQLAKGRIGLLLLVALALLVGFAIPGNLEAKDVPLLPRTDHMVNFLTAPLVEIKSFWILITLLTVFYAGELVWKERETGINEIANTAPVPEWVLFGSKFLALSFMLIVWLAFLMIAGIVAQTVIGGAPVEVGLYVMALFGLQLVECLLFALLALVVHVLVNQKYLGHFFALLAYGFIAFAPSLGIGHKLLIYSASPAWSYTTMAGFNLSLEPWLWFKLYWVSWALLLAVVAKLFWVRGREGKLRSRLNLAKRRITRSTAIVATVAVAGILVFGGFIYYNTNVLNNYLSSSELAERQAQYEQLYGKYYLIPQPRQISANLQVEIYPEERTATVKGTYLLVNQHKMPLDAVHVATAPGVETKAMVFNQPAANKLEDKQLGYHIYALEKPLQPGDSLQLSFEVQVGGRSFSNNGADVSVTPNSTNFRNYEWLPAIGYQSYRELDDAGSRKKYGLASRPATPSLYDEKARMESPFAERITFEAVVSTDMDQVVVAPGVLQRTWTEGNRRYFHYATDATIRNEYYFFSGNYAVREGMWKNHAAGSGQDVSIQIYYDPGQTHNLERMVQSVQASLEHYSKEFGPYPHRTIRFVAYPGYGFGNHAAPINITAGEGFFLMNPDKDKRKFDLVTAVVAHEVAHQWWGNQLDPAHAEGAGLLSESMAWYSAMGVLEDKYGSEYLQRLLSFLREEYKTPKTQAAVPLLQANDWYQNYRKGPFALYAMSQYVGRDKVNGALRQLLEKHGSGKPPLPTSLDLYHELQAVTPDSLQPLLYDLFEKNTFWELSTEQATAKRVEAGKWQVTLNVQARKFVVDSIGVETKLPMNDWVEIGVFAPAEKGQDSGKLLYQRKHRINSAKQRITVTVPGKPAFAGIDPNNLLIDWEIKDNSQGVKL
ncbi:peptidase M1-like protein [Pontibacter ummariensis]|uniref:Peptidase family M1 n=1 Tax=Pontibacter ummariensis TaxID=1610492 RepID=A0A239JXW2_9BACT|nr:M1 family aminopeptidase [Pontibacter ummariensis]PRY07277.1 peptidase M1-like protein [Pontibacter ummariensis]SNT10620.1 Peptidase family M1 [Pontibacter ummariensis]